MFLIFQLFLPLYVLTRSGGYKFSSSSEKWSRYRPYQPIATEYTEKENNAQSKIYICCDRTSNSCGSLVWKDLKFCQPNLKIC